MGAGGCCQFFCCNFLVFAVSMVTVTSLTGGLFRIMGSVVLHKSL